MSKIANTLQEFLQNPSDFNQLHLYNKNITNDDCAKLAAAIKGNNTVNYVYLYQNQIGDQGAASLAEGLKGNNTVTHVYLNQNQIGDQGAASLAEGLKGNNTVTYLNLNQNQIGDQGAASLAEGLKVNKTVTCIQLQNNQIGDQGAASLAEGLKGNNTITRIDLNQNQIGDQGAASLAECLKVNKTITYLFLDNNQITEQGLNLLKASCQGSVSYLGVSNQTAAQPVALANQTQKQVDQFDHDCFFTAFNNDLALVQKSLSGKGIDLNRPDSNGKTLLWHAAFFGREQMVKLLLEGGTLLNCFNRADKAGHTALETPLLLKNNSITNMINVAVLADHVYMMEDFGLQGLDLSLCDAQSKSNRHQFLERLKINLLKNGIPEQYLAEHYKVKLQEYSKNTLPDNFADDIVILLENLHLGRAKIMDNMQKVLQEIFQADDAIDPVKLLAAREETVALMINSNQLDQALHALSNIILTKEEKQVVDALLQRYDSLEQEVKDLIKQNHPTIENAAGNLLKAVDLKGLKLPNNENNWYGEKQIFSLINKYTSHVKVLLPATGLFGLCKQLEQIPQQGQAQHFIPLNINCLSQNFEEGKNNHWAGLYIVKEGNQTSVIYLDPMGKAIHPDLFSKIMASANLGSTNIEQPLLNKPIQYVKQISPIELIGNTDDCGPFLVYCVVSIANGKSIRQDVMTLEQSNSFGSLLRESFNKKEDFNFISLKIAKQNGDKKLIESLRNAINRDLVKAIKNNETWELKQIINSMETEDFEDYTKGPSSFWEMAYDYAPLYTAAVLGHNEIISILVNKNPDWMNITDYNGNNVLHWAVRGRGSAETIKVLLKFATLELIKQESTDGGITPFQCAILNGKTDAAKLLFAANPESINIFDSKGETSLHYAALIGNEELYDKILNVNPKLINQISITGYTVLHRAMASGNLTLIKKVLNSIDKTLIVKVAENSYTALHYAAEKGLLEIAQKILELCPDALDVPTPPGCYGYGYTPLHLAVNNHHSKVCDLLISVKPELLNIKDKDNHGPFDKQFQSRARSVAEKAARVEAEELAQALKLQEAEKLKAEKIVSKQKGLEEEKVKGYDPQIDTNIAKIFDNLEQVQADKSINYNEAIEKILSLIREGNDRLQEPTTKGILLLGNTGAGKTTLAHSLSGRKLQAIYYDELGKFIVDAIQPYDDMVIGHKASSETKIPNKCFANGTTIWDSPGFNDTEVEQEIANDFYLKKLLETTDLMNLVLVIPFQDLTGDRGNNFLKTLSSFMKTFSNIEAIKGSVSLVITKVSPGKEFKHIKNFIEKILRENQSVTNEQRSLVKNFLDSDSVFLFQKPNAEGEFYQTNLLEAIDGTTPVTGSPDLASNNFSPKVLEFASHLLNTAGSNFNKILEITTKAILAVTDCLKDNPNNLLAQNYHIIKDMVPLSIYHKNLPLHPENEYFSELDLLFRLQKILGSNQAGSTLEGLNVLQEALENIAEYAESGNTALRDQIQDYGYCLKQQYEYVKFFSGVCGKELPEAHLAGLLQICQAKVAENLEFQVSSMHIDQSQIDADYYHKAISYLDNYPASKPCIKLKALCYSGLAGVSEHKGDNAGAIGYYIKAIETDNRLPEVYEKLGRLFFSKGEYEKAIEAYKVVNNEFKIKACFKAWLTQEAENPDIMLKQAEYFESIGLFESAKKYYHHAFSLSKNETVKANALEKIGNIMTNAPVLGQSFIQKAQDRDFYNFGAFKFTDKVLNPPADPNQQKSVKINPGETKAGAGTLDTTWYDFLSIKDSLIKKGVAPSSILCQAETNDQLAERLNEINKPNYGCLIPLNVNAVDGSFSATNHWVGLYICTGENTKITTIKYINPIGQKINPQLFNLILERTAVTLEDLTEGKGVQFAYSLGSEAPELKGNCNDCGPMLVQLSYELITYGEIYTHSLNEKESLAFGQKCRKEQRYDEDNKFTADHNQPQAPILIDNEQEQIQDNIGYIITIEAKELEDNLWVGCRDGNADLLKETLAIARYHNIKLNLSCDEGLLGVVAAQRGHISVLRIIDQYDPNLIRNYGTELLSHAAVNGKIDCIEFLLSKQIDPTPLKVTTAYNNYSEVEQLFDRYLQQHNEEVKVEELGNNSYMVE